VEYVTLKRAPAPLRNRRLPRGQFLAAALCVLFLLGSLAGGAAGADLRNRSAATVRPGLAFAVADFDGDSRPDFANVQVGQSDLANTEYWIQFQLSSAGHQSIRVLAPAGGLRLTARDVNGDNWIDLIVTTAWLNQPVAVYINDGHGRFTHAEPADFSAALRECETGWSPLFSESSDAIGAPPRSPSVISLQWNGSSYPRTNAGSVLVSDSDSLSAALLNLQPGRAPPASISNL